MAPVIEKIDMGDGEAGHGDIVSAIVKFAAVFWRYIIERQTACASPRDILRAH